MSLIVLGESPAKGYEGVLPIVGRVNGKLCETGKRWKRWVPCLGLQDEPLTYYNAKGDPEWEALLNRHEERREVANNSLVVCLGVKALAEAKRQGFKNYVKVPHPSGRNRQLNDPALLVQLLNEAADVILTYRQMVGSLRRVG